MITSVANERIKFVRSLQEKRHRQQARAFVIEGVRLLEEAVRSGVTPEIVLFEPGFIERHPRAAEVLRQMPSQCLYAVAPHVLKAAADTVTPQGVVAVVPLPDEPTTVRGRIVLVLDGLQDPGNLGTILRSAEATGVESVITAPGTVDPFSPKVVRAGMGANFRLGIWTDRPWPEITKLIDGRSVRVATTNGDSDYDLVDWLQASALVIGSEAHGPSFEAEALVAERIVIPMAGPTESLNAAVAASVILFEAFRQQRRFDSIHD